MRASIAILALAAAATALPAAAVVSPTSVFDFDRARTFCAAGPEAEADGCLNQQQQAAHRIDVWLVRGDLPRFLAKRTYRNCDIRYAPDYRQTLRCIEDVQDNRRDGRRGVVSGQGITFGR